LIPSPLSALLICSHEAAASPPRSVLVDDDGVVRRLADGRVETARWDDLEEVSVRTLACGPWKEDAYFVLIASDGSGCAVPSAEAKELVERLDHLPGFGARSWELMIQALRCKQEAWFVLWRRSDAFGEAA
jgi:hypothetical protein